MNSNFEKRVWLCRAGFSLIELLVVMVIIGLLASVVGPKLFKNVDKSYVVSAKAQISNFESALQQYRLDKHKYPSTEEGLAVLKPDYMKDIPKDPWGNPYVYKYPGEHSSEFDLFSYGKDGSQGGEDNDKDIVNWDASQ